MTRVSLCDRTGVRIQRPPGARYEALAELDVPATAETGNLHGQADRDRSLDVAFLRVAVGREYLLGLAAIHLAA